MHIFSLYSFHKCLLSSSYVLCTPLSLEDHRTEMLARGELVSRLGEQRADKERITSQLSGSSAFTSAFTTRSAAGGFSQDRPQKASRLLRLRSDK